ncbi:hypothetical protein FKM82_030052 [Ascaphus truei]
MWPVASWPPSPVVVPTTCRSWMAQRRTKPQSPPGSPSKLGSPDSPLLRAADEVSGKIKPSAGDLWSPRRTYNTHGSPGIQIYSSGVCTHIPQAPPTDIIHMGL